RPRCTPAVPGDDRRGEVLSLAPRRLPQLPPLHTALRGGKGAGAKRVAVTLAATCTEIGTLELYLVSKEGNRWRLEFNVRDVTTAEEPEEEVKATVVDVFPEDKVQAAGALIRGCFTTGTPTPQEVTKAIEAALAATRTA